MITFTESAKKEIEKRHGTSPFKLKIELARGGCSSTYFDIELLKADVQDLVKVDSNYFEVYSPMNHVKYVAMADNKIDFIEEYGYGFFVSRIDSSELRPCMCGKSFYKEELISMDLPFNSNGLVESCCQPIE